MFRKNVDTFSGTVYDMDMFPGISLLHEISNANRGIKKIVKADSRTRCLLRPDTESWKIEPAGVPNSSANFTKP